MRRAPVQMVVPWRYLLLVLCVYITHLSQGKLKGQGVETGTLISEKAEDIGAGKILYERSCAYCHGLAGDGEGPVAPFLDVRPRDFTTGIYKFRSTASGQVPTDWDLMRSIRKGMHSTSMVGWEALNENQLWQLIHYIKTFSPERFEMPVDIIPVGPPPEASQERINRGRQLYVDAGCGSCHGLSGKGDGPSAPLLKDNKGDPILSTDLTKGENYKGGHRPGDIYRILMTGIDGTPMPSYRGTFEDMGADPWDLVHYLRLLAGEE